MTSIRNLAIIFTAGVLVAAAVATSAETAQYLVGVGVGDVTGPAADVNLMGYAVINQTAKGIHTRQYARCFVFADPNSGKRFIFAVVDAAMISQLLTIRVIQRLQGEYGQLYSSDNVVLTATHSHATAGGFLEHFLYHITSLGFVKQTFDALSDGIFEACRAAQADLQPASVSWSEGELLGANINRSPSAYLANPAEERAQYKYDVDKDMTILKIKAAATIGSEPKGRALLSFFPVHPVSMNNTNRLLSSDNKGAAEQFVEKRWAPRQPQLEKGFRAAFVQSNGADTSPNVQGTFCLDSGQPCDQITSTCNGNNQLCVGRGPAWPDDTKSTEIIGQLQADKAQELWFGPSHAVTGPIDYRHIFIDMTNMEVKASNLTRAGHTCPGAMGYSFAAGTTDGPGAQGFYQSDRHTGFSMYAPLSHIVNGALHSLPSQQQQSCQAPKPVLLNVGEATKPYPWVPKVTELTVLRLGNFVIVCLPGEFTTMSGRRVRNAVYQVLKQAWGPDVKVVLATLSNTYSSYVTTYEEFQQQRYEGGSTLYGPHTLDAYIQTAVALSEAMVSRKPVASTVSPADLESKVLSLLPPVIVDTVPPGHAFGGVVKQPRADTPYKPGQVVDVVFWAANPRNNLRRGGTFLEVQHQLPGSQQWITVFTDDDWCTKFMWDRPKGSLSSESTATIQWTVAQDVQNGRYRIKYLGDAKTWLGKVISFEGVSREFTVAS